MIEKVFEMGREYSVKGIIKDTIKQTNQNLSLLADDLITTAEKYTKTKDEYVAFMKGAAFIFYNIAQRERKYSYDTSSPISTPKDAVEHCIKLLPFMAGDEKVEHLNIIAWLNELIERRGDKPIQLPSEYYSDEQITEAIEEYKKRLHANKHEAFENTKFINF